MEKRTHTVRLDAIPEDEIQKKDENEEEKNRKMENVCIPAVSGISLLNRFQQFRN